MGSVLACRSWWAEGPWELGPQREGASRREEGWHRAHLREAELRGGQEELRGAEDKVAGEEAREQGVPDHDEINENKRSWGRRAGGGRNSE